MKKWKETNVYTGQEIEEDAPTSSAGCGNVAGLGVDAPGYPGSGEPGVDPKKKKKKLSLIDGRTKAYREHRKRLEMAKQKRENAKIRKEGFTGKILDKMK